MDIISFFTHFLYIAATLAIGFYLGRKSVYSKDIFNDNERED